MNKITIIGIISLILGFSHSIAWTQDEELEHENYDWEESPRLSDYSTTDTSEAYIYLKNLESHEFIDRGESLAEYVLTHRHVKVFTDYGIERFNRLYLPMSDGGEIIVQKARVINSKGEVIQMKEEDIKEGVDEDSGSKYRYFALDGIDKGTEIEYIYMYTQSPSLTGSLKNIQQSALQFNYSFEVIAPSRLDMAFKIYNDADKTAERDTSKTYVEKEKSRWIIHYDTVEGLASERTSAYESEIIYFGYKLASNYSIGKKDLYSYSNLSEYMFEFYHGDLEKKEEKFIKKLSRQVKIPKKATDREKIRAIEDFVKTKVRVIDANFSADITLEQFWDSGVMTEGKALILMGRLFDHFEVDYQIGLTSDRFKFKFDEDFELWAFADKYIVYFPAIDDFTTANSFERVGLFDEVHRNNKGLFLKRVEIAGESYGVGEIHEIPVNDYRESVDTLHVKVDFNEQGFDDTEYSIYHSLGGYKANYIQPYFQEIEDEEDQKEFRESLLTFIDGDGEVVELDAKNLGIDYYGIAPIRATGILKSNNFFEKARDNYLFKVGELIGPQMEMYSEEERKLPVEDYYARNYHRVIEFVIPDGYKVENLEKLNINKSYKDASNDVRMAFVSNYQQVENKVIIHVDEYYKDVYYPVEVFNTYQEIINAAADFNKVVVVFSKE